MKKYLLFLFFLFFLHKGVSQQIVYRDSLAVFADSIYKEGEYKRAANIYKDLYENYPKGKDDTKYTLVAKYYYTLSSDYENFSYYYTEPGKEISKETREIYLDSALIYSNKALETYRMVKKPNKIFLYDIHNRIYHQNGFRGNWEKTLDVALNGLAILKDTLAETEKVFVNLIYDIGYIHAKLGNYSEAIRYYQKSIDLYRRIVGKYHNDVGQAYTDIAKEYKKIGLRKMELKSLLEATDIWENLNTEGQHKAFLYQSYRNLFNWYLYYGDFAKAESYKQKMDTLREEEARLKGSFMRNADERYEDKLKEWFDYMEFYLKKGDTLKALAYKKYILYSIQPQKKATRFKYEPEIYARTIIKFSDIAFNTHPDQAIAELTQAVNYLKKNRKKFGTDPTPAWLKKTDLLIRKRDYRFALAELNAIEQQIDTNHRQEQFTYFINRGRVYEATGISGKARLNYDRAFQMILKKSIPPETAKSTDLRPLITYENIDAFIRMGDFYFDMYLSGRGAEFIKTAFRRYRMASHIYNEMYLGQQYNEQLYSYFSRLNQRLLDCVVELPGDQQLAVKAVNIIENNSSKLTWLKFITNLNRKFVQFPEKLLKEEEAVFEQIRFYNSKLFNENISTPALRRRWHDKVFQLGLQLNKIRDSIKQQYQRYHRFNAEIFDITRMQERLNPQSALIKYLYSGDMLYVFFITGDQILTRRLPLSGEMLQTISDFLEELRNMNPAYAARTGTIKKMLFQDFPVESYRDITIIPDGNLFYLPFEVLVYPKETPVISYGTSLRLLDAQNNVNRNRHQRLGIFTETGGASGTDGSNFELPNISGEINTITSYFGSDIYPNATKSTFLEKAPDYSLLHLAMHSELDMNRADNSSIIFSAKEKDNKLHISELYNATLNADLVVLSACNTGVGSFKNGEGMISVSRAFTFAGTPGSVMSLWPVPDKETSEIMASFYSNLKRGFRVDEALYAAKRSYLKNTDDPLLQHPYFWAGFVVSGNTSPVAATQSKRVIWPYVLIAVILLPLGYRLLKRS